MTQRRKHSCHRSRLTRDPHGGIVLGVCAGVADFLGFNLWAVRLAGFVSLMVFTVPTLVVYFLAGALLEKKPAGLYANSGEEVFWRWLRTDPGRAFDRLRRRFRDLEGRLRNIEAHVTSPAFKLQREIDDLDK